MTSSLDQHYWENRWQQGDIGWHQQSISPSLTRYWSRLELAGNERVLVPFCGKSLDMVWLVEQGHAVLGVEVSTLAIRQFFEENQIDYHTEQHSDGCHYLADNIEIIAADIFNVAKTTLATCTAVYDRAAMVAQTAAQRQHYVAHIYAAMPVGCRALLLVIDYPQTQRQGPPFSVSPDEVSAHFNAGWQQQVLEQNDILALNEGFQQAGVDYLHSGVYFMVRQSNR